MDNVTEAPPELPTIERLHYNDLLPAYFTARPDDPDWNASVAKAAGALEPLQKILNDYHQVEQRAREIRHKLTTGQAIAADDPFPGLVRFTRLHVERHLAVLRAASLAAERLVELNDRQFTALAEAARPTPGAQRTPAPPPVQAARPRARLGPAGR